MSEKIAKYLTVILGPHIWFPVLFVIIILKSNLGGQQLAVIFPSIFTLLVIIPICYLIIAPKKGWISSWEMKIKEERKPFLMLMIALTTIALVIIHFWGNAFLFNLTIVLISIVIVLFGITKYWKISLHASLNTFAAILINFLFG